MILAHYASIMLRLLCFKLCWHINGGLIQTFHNNIKNEELHTTYNWYQGQVMLFNSLLSMHTFFEKHVGGRLFLFFIMIKTIYMQF